MRFSFIPWKRASIDQFKASVSWMNEAKNDPSRLDSRYGSQVFLKIPDRIQRVKFIFRNVPEFMDILEQVLMEYLLAN
jgi:hypothetical protein